MAAGGPAACACVLGFAGGAGWVFDLMAHFRVQYAVVLLACAAVAAAARGAKLAGVLAGFAMLNGAVIAPLFWGGGTEERVLRLAHVNVFTANRDHDAVARWIAESDADAVIAMEVNGRWARALAETPGYSVAFEAPREDNFGMMLLVSSGGVAVTDVALAAEVELPAIEATIAGVRVLGLHTLPPVSRDYARRRDEMLGGAARWAKSQSLPAVVMGDYNATPWSAAFRRFASESGLVDSQRGFGVQPSWPMQDGLLGRALRIPIDHCFHSPSLLVVGRVVGPPNGSDHRPLVIDLARREP